MSFPHNFLFNIKEERHYKIKFMEIFFVSTCICFNYTYFICQKTMILFTKTQISLLKRCESRTGNYWCHNKTLITFYTCSTG